ncbi:heme-dependent oxidative N-demethylase family protein [Microbulbifer guangxiensis]|uniref:heme-dependent oxidative N-demethylase family protein n=1 Tax=Microbulbifer guangxiensis TaxID=2904249 RepID=UPI001F36EE46|nr:DUF3445 domain-containing protein [Microbulbifer guangxiensis]
MSKPGAVLPHPVADRRYAQPEPFLLPFMQHRELVHMGLQRLDPACWIQPCQNLHHYHHNKLNARRALGERVFAALPRSQEAQEELRGLLLQHLCRDHAPQYRRSANALQWRQGGAVLRWSMADAGHPLWGASLWVADDLCLLQPGDSGYELTAASLAAPSYWRLEDKIGRPLDQIHKPVPGFANKLSAQVGRFFDHLLADYPVWRSNWSVVSSPELLQRGNVAAADGPLYLRVERQSLRRLPQTGAVVFTIRVSLNPLADLHAVPGAVAALAEAVKGMSPDESRYKSLAPLLPRLQAFLASAQSAVY